MILRDYIRDGSIEIGKFAERIGVSRQTLYLYVNGGRFPRPAVLRRIHEETNGAVTANDFLPAAAPVCSSPTTGDAR